MKKSVLSSSTSFMMMIFTFGLSIGFLIQKEIGFCFLCWFYLCGRSLNCTGLQSYSMVVLLHLHCDYFFWPSKSWCFFRANGSMQRKCQVPSLEFSVKMIIYTQGCRVMVFYLGICSISNLLIPEMDVVAGYVSHIAFQ